MERVTVLVALLATSGLQVGAVSPPGSQVAADQGNWTVGDCILVRMASMVELQPDPDNTNLTVKMELPVDAVADGSCSFNTTGGPPVQRVVLAWSEEREAVRLHRNITLEFSRNETTRKYGVSRISAVYEVNQYIVNTTGPDPNNPNETISINVTVTSYVSMTTFKMDPWEFLVPLNRSYLCTDAGSKPMHTELHKSNEHSGDGGVKLPDAVLSATKVQLDAFRGEMAPVDEFQTAMDCTYRPNDVVPIVVGCALAGLVLMVLIAYLVGRRKSRARGYQSV